jgi:hypothetical protein
MHNFLVVFMPADEATVDKMQVVDAWACSSPSIPNARRMMMNNEREGQYAKFGDGYLQVVKQDTCHQYNNWRTYEGSR